MAKGDAAGERFYGCYAALSKITPCASFEPVRSFEDGDEREKQGRKDRDSDTIYLGARLLGKAPGSIDYRKEAVKEAGNYADDVIDALGYVGGGGWTIPTAPLSLRVSGDYAYASGDSGAIDGHRQNFD